MADYSGDETDGLNETLCPCDFKHVSSDPISRLLEACCTCMPSPWRGLTSIAAVSEHTVGDPST